jgi:[Skp1-protein]-hydroxyproline N-acetylglucosaminyltransferase
LRLRLAPFTRCSLSAPLPSQLNEGWAQADGGELELRLGSGDDGVAAPTLRVCPELNRAVFFRSSLEHRVLPNARERLALTVWLERRAEPSGAGGSGSAPVIERTLSPPLPAATESALGADSAPHPAMAAAAANDAAPLPARAPPPPSPLPPPLPLPTIFVSVPAYRDPEAQHTLHDLFARADRPERVWAGLVWQGDVESGEDARCFARPLPAEWAGRVRTHWMHWREARGPTLARALAQGLWRRETHYLQIDSHTRFAPGWDTLLLAQLEAAEADAAERAGGGEPARAIITTYPAWYERPDLRSPDDRPPLMCARAAGGDAFGADGLLRLRARTLARRPARPVPSLFWAAGFAFSRSSVISEVPYDGGLPFLFFGEEAAMSARLWTSGYDFYAPTTNLVYHLWDRSYRETFWQLADAGADKPRSIARVQRLLAGAPAVDDELAAAGAHEEAGETRARGVRRVVRRLIWRAHRHCARSARRCRGRLRVCRGREPRHGDDRC